MRILGIDPGLDGGLGLVCDYGHDLRSFRMPTITDKKNKRHICEPVLTRLIYSCSPDIAYVEKVSGMRGWGVSSTFKFGVGYGVVLGILHAFDIPVHLVQPRAWKKVYGLGKDKGTSIQVARHLFPSLGDDFKSKTKDNGRAEALLIASYKL